MTKSKEMKERKEGEKRGGQVLSMTPLPYVHTRFVTDADTDVCIVLMYAWY